MLEVIDERTDISHRVGKRPDKSAERNIYAHCNSAVDDEDTADDEQYNRKSLRKRFNIREEREPSESRVLV